MLHRRSCGSGGGPASSAKSRIPADRNRSRVVSVISFSTIKATGSDFLGCSNFHQEGSKLWLSVGLAAFYLRRTYSLSPVIINEAESDRKGTQKAWCRKLWLVLGLLA